MEIRRWIVAIVACLIAGPAFAEPIDTWPLIEGIDCVGDRFNPIQPDGTRDPLGDPDPNTPEWTARDNERLECLGQRDSDRRWQPPPVNQWSIVRYGEDYYRIPLRFDGQRFRYTYLPSDLLSDLGLGIPGVPAAEIYRPCASGTCPDLPAELQRFDPPYPVVVIHHGFIATMTHHRFNAQVYAENGYMAILVNGIHPIPGAPNVQDDANGGEVVEWLASAASGAFGDEADLNRVAMVGHSQGAAAARSYQGDPRVHTIVAWDGGDDISDENCTEILDADGAPTGAKNPCQPIMYQRTDGAFSAPQATARMDYPAERDRGLETYMLHTQRDMDVFHVTFRATSHIDWGGNGIGILAGNRLAEPVINYYTLGWLDRHLKGKLVFDDQGVVVTSGNRTEPEERAYRQAIAEDAFRRLTAQKFPNGSIDKHNVSMGFFDPVKLLTSGDLLFGGNAPYTIEGLWTTDRLAQDYRSYCYVTVPDYVHGDDGVPGDGIAPLRVADTGGPNGPGPAEDMRIYGCTETAP